MDLFTYLSKNSQQKLDYFLETLSDTNRTPEYYTNWGKVFRNTRNFEISINTLEYLIGKDDIETEARELFKMQPHLLQLIPVLLAIRDQHFKVLDISNDTLTYEYLDFRVTNTEKLEEKIKFMKEAGLLDLLQNHIRSSLLDYLTGVEVGLDSNGRKNRSGNIMENIIEKFVSQICSENSWEFMSQATAEKIFSSWGYTLASDKTSRRHDFAIYDKKSNKIALIETNYYGGGGSKLKSVAGEFSDLNRLLLSQDPSLMFLWITDGQGWNKAKQPLLESMQTIHNIFNLDMLNNNYLQDVLRAHFN